MVEIIFEAHGTTFDNEAHLSSGHNDIELSPLGIQQSKEMGMRYKDDHFDAIFCSDLQRAYKSAEIGFGDRWPIIQDARLRECDYGDFTQHPSTEVDAEKSKRIHTPFPNGESYDQTTARMKSFLDDLSKNYDGKRVMIIGHRATQYGLDHLINGVSLEKLTSSNFKWQPGWKYELRFNEEAAFKIRIKELLGKEITKFSLKGKGDCNYAYYVETNDGSKYIVKQEREHKETQDQNDLVVEGNLIRQLYDSGLSVSIPHIVFVAENPKTYGYDYIEGEMMRGIWGSLSEEEKIDICHSLGGFHAEIGKKFTKEMSQAVSIDINDSISLHPVVLKDYNNLIVDASVPDEFKALAKEAKAIFDGTGDKVVFQFLHNDGHHENVLIKDKKISGIIDYGDSEYGEVAKEFSRWIRDYPDYFAHIVSAYEQESGNKLSYKRLVTNALLSGFIEIVEDYRKGGEERLKAENAIATYRRLILG